MAKRFSELRAKMSPAAKAEAARVAAELRKELPLHQLRQALKLSQERTWQGLSMAEWEKIPQPGGLGVSLQQAPARIGTLKVVTRNLRAGYALRFDDAGVHVPGLETVPWSAVHDLGLRTYESHGKQFRQFVITVAPGWSGGHRRPPRHLRGQDRECPCRRYIRPCHVGGSRP